MDVGFARLGLTSTEFNLTPWDLRQCCGSAGKEGRSMSVLRFQVSNHSLRVIPSIFREKIHVLTLSLEFIRSRLMSFERPFISGAPGRLGSESCRGGNFQTSVEHRNQEQLTISVALKNINQDQ